MRYKMRAECLTDIKRFISKSKLSNFKFQFINNYPDVIMEFESKLTLNEINMILHDIVDSHVMYQTVQPIEKYTGERDFSIY